jgi:uncharacterized membrane protein YbhN (UPF0104 family)
MPESLKRLLRNLPPVLGLLLLVGAVYVMLKEFRTLKVEAVVEALHSIPRRAILTALCWNVLSYGVLTFYDRLAIRYAGRRVAFRRTAFASFCAYALAHNLGFAAVSGAAVRYRLYAHWGLTPMQIAKVVTFCSLTFALGGMVLGGLVLFFEPTAVPLLGGRLPAWLMHAVGAVLWLLVVAYVALAERMRGRVLYGHRIELPGWRMAILQVLLATVDVAVTTAIVYSLLPEAPGLTFVRFLGIYVSSYTAGLAANIPGGLGVFDTAMLVGLAPYLRAPTILGAIVVFRLYYYVIPLFLAGSLFAGNEILLRSRRLLRPAPTMRGAQATRWSEPDFAIAAVSGAVAMCGVLLLCLGVVESRPDFSWIDPDFAAVANPAGAFVPSLIGAALLVCVAALSQRVTLAWSITVCLLLAAAVFTLADGDPIWIPALLVLGALLVAPFRAAFYRHARLLSGPMDPAVAVPLLTLAGCILALAASAKHVRWLSDNSWWEVVMSPDLANSLRATVAFTVVVAGLALYGLLRPGRVRVLRWGAEARLRYAALGADPPAEADGIVWGETERAGIPFRRTGRVLLGIGDPAGAESDRISAIWRLRDLARQEGLHPAIWRAGRTLLKVYADLGLAALPLGEDGLPCDQAEEGEPTAQEFLVCQAERDLATLMPLLPGLAKLARRAVPPFA